MNTWLIFYLGILYDLIPPLIATLFFLYLLKSLISLFRILFFKIFKW